MQDLGTYLWYNGFNNLYIFILVLTESHISEDFNQILILIQRYARFVTLW